MYLKRLTINGFKSFATKAVLELEPGIVAVVGPNGSGKSNIADAIRWALGEQSTKQLRSKKSEELVFAGTEKRAKGSMAEVSLLMDNSDGGMAIDFSEVELSRLLYRSGESDYKLNGRKVKLSEVQQLLVQSGFGPNSYAVIGQGMIDSFILATPAERKLLFDEASGIRQYELKREAALRKLDATEQNLTRVRDILTELAPRLKTLERSVNAAKERQELAHNLGELRATYLATAERLYNEQTKELVTASDDLRQQITKAEAELTALEAQRRSVEEHQQSFQARKSELTQKLHASEAERDHLVGELGVKRAELALAESQENGEEVEKRVGEIEKSITDLSKRYQKLTDQLAEARTSEADFTKQLDKISDKIGSAQDELNELRREATSTSRPEYIAHALSILKQVSYGLANGHDAEQLRLLVYKAGRLLSHASQGGEDVIEGVKSLQQKLNKLMAERESVHEPYTTTVIQVRSLELDLDHIDAQLKVLRQELSDLTTRQKQAEANLRNAVERQQAIHDLEETIESKSQEINSLREQLSEAVEPHDVFVLAQELEAAKFKLSAAQSSLQEKIELLSALAHEKNELQERSQLWGVQSTKPVDKSLEVLERELATLEGRLAAGEEAEHDVLEEYEESSKRFAFMSEQVTDLEKAGQDLIKVIGQLEDIIKRKFEESFAGIAQHFTTYFEQLFGGGKASLVLRADATGTYGIEIKAVPPGKRVESLATLSGGERSMTGIALLAAILQVNPSPFVVLDEVDAALDEANSGRLAKILKDISKQSQLVIITHNRQVMAAADAIFGVTMDAHHVSRLLSVKLEQARELAAA